MKIRLSFLLVVAATLAFGRPLAASVVTGETAPDFTLTDLDGQQHSLSEYRGKTVVLEWNNPDCPIVRKHYESGNIPDLQSQATRDGIVWLMINSGAAGQQGGDYSPAELKQWLQSHHSAPSDYFRDQDGTVGHRYGAKTTPHMFVINDKGVLVYQGAIDSIPSARQSDIPKAKNYVRAALASLKAGQLPEDSDTKPYGCSVKY